MINCKTVSTIFLLNRIKVLGDHIQGFFPACLTKPLVGAALDPQQRLAQPVAVETREDLALGLNVAYTVFPTQELEQKIKSLGVDFTMGYYF